MKYVISLLSLETSETGKYDPKLKRGVVWSLPEEFLEWLRKTKAHCCPEVDLLKVRSSFIPVGQAEQLAKTKVRISDALHICRAKSALQLALDLLIRSGVCTRFSPQVEVRRW